MFKLLAIAAAATCSAVAQNTEISFLYGFSGPNGSVVLSPSLRVEGSVGASYQVAAAFQVLDRGNGGLYVEVPLTLVANVSGVVANGVQSSTRGIVFLTPGIRYKQSLHSRLAVYGVLGGGLGSFGQELDTISSGGVAANISTRTNVPVLDFGGGIDIRLTRLLSLRAEERDFVSRSGQAGFAGHNHPVFGVGVGFHF